MINFDLNGRSDHMTDIYRIIYLPKTALSRKDPHNLRVHKVNDLSPVNTNNVFRSGFTLSRI